MHCAVQARGSSSCTESNPPRLVRHWDAHQMQKIDAQWNLTDKIVETVVAAIREYSGEHLDDHQVTDIFGHLIGRHV